MKCSYKINTFISQFAYNPIITILNLMKIKKITQIDVSNYIGINERNTRKYFLRKTKLTRHFLSCICCILELPELVSLELFKCSGLELTLLNDGPLYYEFIKTMKKYTIEENIKRLNEKKL